MKKIYETNEKNVRVKLTELTPASYNVRQKFNDLKTLADSLKTLGQLNPLIIDEFGIVLSGNRRLAAMKTLNWEFAVCDIKVDLTGFQKKALLFSANTTQKNVEIWTNREYIAKMYWDEFLSEYEAKTSADEGLTQFARYMGVSHTQIAKVVKMFDDENRVWVDKLRQHNIRSTVADSIIILRPKFRKLIADELIEKKNELRTREAMRKYVQNRNRELIVNETGKVPRASLGHFLRRIRDLNMLIKIQDELDDKQKEQLRKKSKPLFAFLKWLHEDKE